jgi:hypothetical protein
MTSMTLPRELNARALGCKEILCDLARPTVVGGDFALNSRVFSRVVYDSCCSKKSLSWRAVETDCPSQ